MTHERELERLAEVYEHYRTSGWRSKWDPDNPGNRAIVAEREARLRALLTDHGFLPWRERRLLEIGCGAGPWLELFLRWGAPPERLAGIDLIAERIAEARTRLPETVELVVGDAAALPWPEAHFDLVLLSTVLSSVLEEALARRIAAEAWRVLRPGGAIVWYDFRYDNPTNPNVRGIGRRRIQELFPAARSHLELVTLLPPLARRLGRWTPRLYPLLVQLPPLRSHYLGLLCKPRSE